MLIKYSGSISMHVFIHTHTNSHNTNAKNKQRDKEAGGEGGEAGRDGSNQKMNKNVSCKSLQIYTLSETAVSATSLSPPPPRHLMLSHLILLSYFVTIVLSYSSSLCVSLTLSSSFEFPWAAVSARVIAASSIYNWAKGGGLELVGRLKVLAWFGRKEGF